MSPDEQPDTELDEQQIRAIVKEELGNSSFQTTRRGLLASLGLIGGAGLLSAPASAEQFPNAGQGQVGTSSHPLLEVNSEQGNFENLNADGLAGGLAGGTIITNLVGEGLEVDASGNLIAPSDGSAVAGSTLEINQSFGAGAWCWFGGPVGVYNQQSDTTYIGGVRGNGDIVAVSYDHSSETIMTTVLNSTIPADDHNNPGVLLRSDGHLVYYYTDHLNGGPFYYRVSSSPRDISSFGSQQTISRGSRVDYSNPRQRASDGRIYLFYRQDYNGLYEIHSDDGGSTWSSSNELISPAGRRTYFQLSEMHNGRVDIAITRNTADPNESNIEDVGFCYFEDGSLFDVDGNSLGSTPITDTSVPVIYDSSASGNANAWVWDVAYYDGEIEVVWATIPSYTAHDYYWARYDTSSGSWTTAKVDDGGQFIGDGNNNERAYSGGIALDTAIPGRVYYSVPTTSDSAETYVAETDDNGATWTRGLISAPNEIQARPMVPVDRHPEIACLWFRGRYDYFTNYSTTMISGYGAGPAVGDFSSGGGSGSITEVTRGFESGDFSNWSNTGDVQITTSTVYEGSYAMQSSGSGNSPSTTVTAGQYGSLSWAGRVPSSTFGSDARPIGKYLSGSTDALVVGVDDGDVVGTAGSVIVEESTGWVDAGFNVTADEYHDFRLTNIDYGAGTFDLAVVDSSGSQVGSSTGLAFKNSVSEIDGLLMVVNPETVQVDSCVFSP